MNTAEALVIVNSSLTRSGNNPITAFDDGSDEAVVASANYEEVVKEELAAYPYSWAKEDVDLDRIDAPAIDEWAYVFQLPAILVKLVRVHVDGRVVPYKQKGRKLYCGQMENVSAEYISRADESEWSFDFRGKIITRLEAIFLRALSEDYEKAELREDRAESKGLKVQNQDSQNQTPRDRRIQGRLVAIRRA